jgi:hypothetical protein
VKRAIACGISLRPGVRSAWPRRSARPVVITPGGEKTYRIAVQRFADDPAKPNARAIDDFRDKVLRALEFSGVFTKIDDAAFLGPVTTPAGAKTRSSNARTGRRSAPTACSRASSRAPPRASASRSASGTRRSASG